jgi:hypothetical protein
MSKITNKFLAQMPTLTLKGNNTGGTANPLDLTVAQVNAILPVFTSTLNGLAPLSGGGSTNFLRADGTWAAPAGSGGTVTSVALADGSTTPIYAISGSPVTSSGTLTLTLDTQSAATFFAGPATGSAAQPTFRAIVATDIPTLNQNTTGTAANITATSNSTLTTLSALSLPGSQVTGNISGNAANVTGTVVVANGGTGDTSFTAYAVVTGGTTSGGALQNVSGVGTTGALPTWQSTSSSPTSNYFNGSMSNASSWSTTSSTFTDATNTGGNTLTTVYSSGITVTAAASNLAGITFTPSSTTAVYKITALPGLFEGSNNDNTVVQITDGTTPFGYNTLATPTGLAGQTNACMPVGGIYAPGTTSAVTVKLQLAAYGGGTANIKSNSSPAIPAIQWEIIQIRA